MDTKARDEAFIEAYERTVNERFRNQVTARILNDQGITTRQGKKWTEGAVQKRIERMNKDSLPSDYPTSTQKEDTRQSVGNEQSPEARPRQDLGSKKQEIIRQEVGNVAQELPRQSLGKTGQVDDNPNLGNSIQADSYLELGKQGEVDSLPVAFFLPNDYPMDTSALKDMVDSYQSGDIRQIIQWFESRKEESMTQASIRPIFKGKRFNTGLMINEEVLRRAREKQATEVARVGKSLNNLMEILLWQYIGCPEDVIEQ